MARRPKWQLALAGLMVLALVPFSCTRHDGDLSRISASKVPADGVVEFFELTTTPVLLKYSPPRYPAAARESGLSGDVFVQFIVSTEGVVEEAKVLRGEVVFRSAALDAVRGWRYEPAEVDGRPVRVRMTVPIRFKLDLTAPSGTNPATGGEYKRVPAKGVGDHPESDYHLGEKGLVAKLIKTVPPRFPRLAEKAGLEGVVVVLAQVGTDGKVTHVEVLKGHEIFRQSAMDAVRQFEFEPPSNGTPVEVQLPISFYLSTTEAQATADESVTPVQRHARAESVCRVWVNAAGDVMVDLQPVERSRLQEIVKQRLDGDDELIVEIKAEAGTQNSGVMDIVRAVRAAGARDIRLPETN